MSKRTHFVTVTPLPAGISRETVLQTLHCHTEMIDLNPLVIERHPIKPPREAAPEEINCEWYSISDKVQYIPGVYAGKLTFNACFHDLPDGLQSHIYAPMGLDMRGRWSIGGSLPGEPRQPVEMGHGIPKTGLYLREDVDMRCNFAMVGFVRKTTKKTHHTLVERLIEKSHVKENESYNNALGDQLDLRNQYPPDYHTSQNSSGVASPVATPYFDHKPPIQQHPSFSNQSSMGGRTPSYHDQKQGYIQPGMGAPPPMASPPAMGMGAPPLMVGQSYRPYSHYPPAAEMAGPTAGHYGVGAPHGPNHLGTNFSVELPSEESKTPIEIANSEGAMPRR